MNVQFRYTVLIQILSLPTFGQGVLHLKGEVQATKQTVERTASPGWQVRAHDVTRRHVLITPLDERRQEALEVLAASGGKVVGEIPGGALVAVLPADLGMSIDLAITQELTPANKLSPALSYAEDAEGAFVVEFHPDVSDADAASIVFGQGLNLREHPDLAPHHLLVTGAALAAAGLSEWDEIAYVFPASAEMVRGEALLPCAGLFTLSGSIAQYIATVGDGWDGPGKNAAALTYSYQTLTSKVAREAVAGEIEKALGAWSRSVALTFTQTEKLNGARNLNFLFAAGEHGDGYAFDGRGKVLAHTFYPSAPNPEPLAGDLHFDADENWNIGAETDLFSVVLHELGHALGLGHSDNPGAVMYPYYKRVGALTTEDVNSALQLYAAPSSATAPLTLTLQAAPATVSTSTVDLSGTVAGGSGDVSVNWTCAGRTGAAVGGRTWNISAFPLSTGSNAITVAAQDAVGSYVARTISITRTDSTAAALRIAIVSPAAGSVVKQASVVIGGTTSGSITRVGWSNSRGGQGTASGLANWSASVALQEGQNTISFTAYGSSGATVQASVMLTYSKIADTTAPTVVILNPNTSIVRTSASTFVMSGSAADNVGVAQVTWSTNFSYSGIASGTGQWTASGIPLLVGDNVVTVRARDAAGNTGWRSITVVRR